MKIERAIEILEGYCRQETSPLADDFIAATKLGIEALKEIQYLHDSQVLREDELLPGETKP